MPDLNSDALGIWEHLKPAIDKEIEQKTRGMVQRRKMKVTTAPSISTGTIGVTEAFGSEMVIPFATNLISATVGDMVWVEFMYGATNAFASMFASADEKDWDVAGDLSVSGSTSLQNTTINGVLDVTPRRCYATLSRAGWYRVCKTADVSGTIIDFSIGRPYGSALAEAHRISLYVVGGGKSAFLNETSDTNTLFVDKIRCTYGGGFMYFDVHYNSSASNEVLVYFDVYGKGQANGTSVSMGLTSVAPSPSGETVLTEYTFAADTEAVGTVVGASGFMPAEIDVKRSGRVVYVHFYVQNVSIAANTNTLIGTISGVPLPKQNIRWLAGGGAWAYNAATPVYAILETNGNIAVTSPSAIRAVNITISYIV